MPGKGLESAMLDCHLLYVFTGRKNSLETGAKGTQCTAVQLNLTQRPKHTGATEDAAHPTHRHYWLAVHISPLLLTGTCTMGTLLSKSPGQV